ncbi:hypothetical protein [Modestobacter sp. SSW1-42]|uniref:hypothetical protein n=1 Tax=Modestobacter sp. SSW1-42 TaxID=596372 RepID=UPI0039879C03
MSTVLPPPVPLPDPPGSREALGAVVDQLTSAGFSAGLTVHLLEPASAVPGWQGADADAAAAEIAAAGAVAADLHDALTAAAARLGGHAELWSSVLARVASLREEQRHQFAVATARLSTVLAAAPGPAPSTAAAVVTEVERDDAARGAQHAALLDDLADDAARAAAALGSLSAPFGGRAVPGDVERVTLRLAGVLPGWGDGALTALGVEAARDLGGPGTAEELDAAARRWTAHASAPVFADALLGRLGEDGVAWLLTVLGGRSVPAEQEPLAGLLAAAAGAAGSGSRAAEVLGAVRVDPASDDGTPDVAAVGMGVVLTALAAGGRAGSGAALAAGWGRQVLARERAQGATAVQRTTATRADPVAAALSVLAAAGDPAAAAALLAGPEEWTGLLARQWPAGAGDLAQVVGLAARAPGAPQVAASVLHALGQGLRPGTAELVLVDGATLTAVGGAVADLVAGQVEVVLPVLGAATGPGDGGVDPATDTALRGLGHLLADDDRVRTVGAAVRAALAAGPPGPAAGQVAGGFVAVEEYGQRIGHVLAWSREHERAVDREVLWTMAVTGPTTLVRGLPGEVVGELAGAAQEWLGFDGTVDIGPDRGASYAAWDARRWAGAVLAADGAGSPDVGGAAEAGFARTTAVLGRPAPPGTSVLDQWEDVHGDLLEPEERSEGPAARPGH